MLLCRAIVDGVQMQRTGKKVRWTKDWLARIVKLNAFEVGGKHHL